MAIKLATKKVKSTEIDHVETGKRVRNERNRIGMSLRELAALMGITPPFLSDLELGRRNWNEDRFNLAVVKMEQGE